MAYLIERDETVGAAVRRIAHEQASDAIDSLDDPGQQGAVEAVHDCRKRCKKIRGLVRLVRPALGGDYAAANTTFRDAARALAPIRDAQALLGTFEDLVAATPDQLPDDGVAGVRAGLRAEAQAATDHVDDQQDRIVEARALLAAGADHIDDWSLSDAGWDAIEGGLRKTYKRGRKALAVVQDAPGAEQFHEWRKRAKYTWYHTRLLADAAPSVLGPLATQLHNLSDSLGDAHDLAILHDKLMADPASYGGEDEVRRTLIVVDGHRSRLEESAVRLGVRLYAEKPGTFVDRIGRYWEAWHRTGEELPTGEIADVHPVT